MSQRRALILFAHPEPKSFNGRMKDRAVATLRSEGWEVEVTDLFRDLSHCFADQRDFPDWDLDFFDLQAAQKQANETRTFPPEILREMEKLEKAELIILQFPLWWQSAPAPVKGYIDRVLSVGFAYGGKYALEGKRAIISSTTGAPEKFWTNEFKGSITASYLHLQSGTLAFCNMEVLKPFMVFGAKGLSEEEKEDYLKEWETVLKRIDQREVLYRGQKFLKDQP